MRTAIFVDAGYLYAAGSKAISGESQPRTNIKLDLKAAVAKLKDTASQRVERWSLLRIYWYDGAVSLGISPEHRYIAEADTVKLRLGAVTSYGKQKGVDSLIVTDLIELARNRAISDAALLSGDEDVRIGVQIAQSFGVRIHLIGIEPATKNQSQSLRRESDTTTEWSKTDVGKIMRLTISVRSGVDTENAQHLTDADVIQQCVTEFSRSLSADDLTILASLGPEASIPYSLDRELLKKCTEQLDRWLGEPEKHQIRSMFKRQARSLRRRS